ncbi:DNA cytosine methyltransferase [Flavobacterium sp. F-65]|uniref:DNA (cytosine-5-)-methyltransferase n=1 Tax=Flavobacterium pisciphilum TaxID=2893755 RepID=A0ABS8MTN1_9FLAO|nr:DNA cytosine methyltransferase [Flavobacterium sp. F-65]MCC9072128.1 DNA cytosine methyltransferase [Flavobacterium sp. F-65]
MDEIPIIDIFAGPGGLAEGFSSLTNEDRNRIFKISLSIEKDEYAHKTLKLRSFYRQFPIGEIPNDYYNFVRGEITIDQLYSNHPIEADQANEEAWCGTLGTPDKKDLNGVSDEEVDERIERALNGNQNWVLIGGPPCQAYSLVGRARRQEIILNEKTDKRVGLYKEYLRILARHNPAVFVMENVKGILSAETEKTNVFNKILSDLKNPLDACMSEGTFIDNEQKVKYRIYSLTVEPRGFDDNGNPIFEPRDYIIKAEDYGVPQKRHRVILLGIREDVNGPISILQSKNQVTLESIIEKLPILRSGVTRTFTHSGTVYDKDGKIKKKRFYEKLEDSPKNWQNHITEFNRVIDEIIPQVNGVVKKQLPINLGVPFIKTLKNNIDETHPLFAWYNDNRLGGVLHHVSRKHLLQDLKRYLFAARYTKLNKNFPRLEDYKQAGSDLLPDHENVESGKFTDRFRVQLPNIPATTVTSHISKDGHYFIHYDPFQCRSLTVREAARIQTFPDNYYFCGERTSQFHQVGNAVPPYLAYQIAEIVHNVLNPIPENKKIQPEIVETNGS